MDRRRRCAGGALRRTGAGVARRREWSRAGLAVRSSCAGSDRRSRLAGRPRKAPQTHGAGTSTTLVLMAIAFGISEVSAHSPPPTPKSRRRTVALPVSTGLAPGVQVKVRVTGLLTPRRARVPSAAYWLPPSARNLVAV